MARVVLTSDAKEDVRDLDGSARKIVLKALKKLEENPRHRGQPLGSRQDDLTGFNKLVVGDREYRVLYRVEADGTVVVVWVVGKRADDACYQLAVSRLRTYTDDPAFARELQSMIEQVWATAPPSA